MTLLTPEQAADRLAISRRSLDRLARAGRIRPVYPVPRRPRYTERELDAYLASLEGRRLR